MALLGLVSVAIILGVAYTYYLEGMLSAFAACISAFISCMVAFHTWPMIANELEDQLTGTFLQGCEDALALSLVFAACFALLRLATVRMINRELNYTDAINRAGGALFGLGTGYFVAGFIVCVAQTLPLSENFLGFQSPDNPVFMTRFLPADQNTLKLMDRAQHGAFKPADDSTTKLEEFSHLFAKNRRYKEPGDPNTTPAQPAPQPVSQPTKAAVPKKDRPAEKAAPKVQTNVKKDDDDRYKED